MKLSYVSLSLSKAFSVLFLALISLSLSNAQTKPETSTVIEEALKTLPQMLPISSVTAEDLQHIRNEVNKTFALYELELAMCREAKETMKMVSLASLDEQLKELDRIREAVLKQDATISELQNIKQDLNSKLAQLQKTLRKAKRRATFERITYSGTIATLTYLLIKTNLPP